MTEIDDWLTRYEKTHEGLHASNIYWASVPMLVVGLSGLLWSLPVPPEFWQISPLLNWGSAFLMASGIYYFIISVPLAIGLLPFLLGLATVQLWLAESGLPAMATSMLLLILGVIGLMLGRGQGLRAMLQDLQLTMIGPAWLLSQIYKRFGIPV